MSRWVFALPLAALLAVPLAAWQQPKAPAPQQEKQEKPQSQQQDQEPPEEDANLQVKEYSFNPVQANKEMQVGNEYYKKHSYKAASMRYREATRWNPNLADAWLKLGEAEEKRRNVKDAKEAFAKYLELQPDSREATEVRKKLASLH